MSILTKFDNRLKSMQPIQIMGIFWLVLGVVVLFGSFFIKGTEHVPKLHGVVTNVIAGAILFIIGLISLLRKRSAKEKTHL